MMEHSAWSAALPTLFNFVLAFGFLFLVARKAFAATIASRSQAVGAMVGEAQKAYSEASALEKEWQAKSDGAKAEIAQATETAKLSLERQKKLTAERAKKESERIKVEAKMVAQGEISRATNSLRREFAHKSVEMAGRYLEGHLGDEDKKSLVKNYTEIVGNGSTR